jgi:DNA-binding CsgD family transcriptional regulator
MMFLLPSRLRMMLEKRRSGILRGIFSKDEQLVQTVREMASSQQRAEQEVYNDIIESGMKALSDTHKYEEIWGLLSAREQQVTALTCMGYRSYEIAGALGVSYETVRTHSKHIYAKFGLGRKELRLALREWNFEAWWANHQG